MNKSELIERIVDQQQELSVRDVTDHSITENAYY